MQIYKTSSGQGKRFFNSGLNSKKSRFSANEMTQQELADKTGMTRQTIVAIENSKYSPTLELAFRISKVFNTPLEKIFSYVPQENSNWTTNKNIK